MKNWNRLHHKPGTVVSVILTWNILGVPLNTAHLLLWFIPIDQISGCKNLLSCESLLKVSCPLCTAKWLLIRCPIYDFSYLLQFFRICFNFQVIYLVMMFSKACFHKFKLFLIKMIENVYSMRKLIRHKYWVLWEYKVCVVLIACEGGQRDRQIWVWCFLWGSSK